MTGNAAGSTELAGRLTANILLRGAGWTFVAAGLVILAYLVYALWFTGFAAGAAQDALAQRWEAEVGVVGAGEVDGVHARATPSAPLPSPAARADARAGAAAPVAQPASGSPAVTAPAQAAPLAPGEAVAVLEFERPGAPPPVSAEPLFVVEGVAMEHLAAGPGHYPGSALPGQPGNLAIAGHRTTYGAPFSALDALAPGDLAHVADRGGQRFTYEVVAQRVVAPDAVEVVGPDPLGTGAPTMTLTTCHPRFSAAQRLVVFAELRA